MTDIGKELLGNITRINEMNATTLREKVSMVATVGTCPGCKAELQDCDIRREKDETAPHGAADILECLLCDCDLDGSELDTAPEIDFED